MKEERRLTVLTIIINSLVSLLKILGGTILSSYSLIFSGYNTLINDINIFISFIGSILRGRRASTSEPFGYGKDNLLPKLFTDTLITILGIYLFIKSFSLEYNNVDLHLLLVLCGIAILFIIWSKVLYKSSLDNRSIFLMDLAHTIYYDSILTITLLFFLILGSFMPVFDLLGSLFGSIIIILKGIKNLFNTIILLKGQNDQSKVVLKRIKKILSNNEDIKYLNATLINISSFYKVIIEVEVSDYVSLNDLVWWELGIKSSIIEERLNVKLVEFNIYQM